MRTVGAFMTLNVNFNYVRGLGFKSYVCQLCVISFFIYDMFKRDKRV